jgi:predicted GTPase
MLSVRLPYHLETQLSAYCESMAVTKSSVVQQALEKHMQSLPVKRKRAKKADPFLALIGSATNKISTDELMRMTRGDDWNKP